MTSQHPESMERVRLREREVHRVSAVVRKHVQGDEMTTDAALLVLGVASSSSHAERRRRYLQLSRLLHADRIQRLYGSVPPRFTAAFQAVSTAYEVLSDDGTDATVDRGAEAGPTALQAPVHEDSVASYDGTNDGEATSNDDRSKQDAARGRDSNFDAGNCGAGDPVTSADVTQRPPASTCDAAPSTELVALGEQKQALVVWQPDAGKLSSEEVAKWGAFASHSRHKVHLLKRNTVEHTPNRFTIGYKVLRAEKGQRQRANQRKRAFRRMDKHGFSFRGQPGMRAHAQQRQGASLQLPGSQ